MSQLCNGCKTYAIIVNGGYGVNDTCRHEGGDNVPPKPSDPHWADIFEAGMKAALEGHPATTQEGHYWHGYEYGLAVLEKERGKEAKEFKNGPRP